MIFLCLGLLTVAVTVSASLNPNGKDSVTRYTLKLSKDGKEYDGVVDIDTKKRLEIFHVPKGSSDEEDGDVLYDFKNGKAMIHLPDAKSCFLSNSTDNVPKPADLIKLLEKSNLSGVVLKRSENTIKLTVVGKLEDRSELSNKMAELCAKLPIYIVAEGDVDQTLDEADDEMQTSYDEQLPKRREKRLWGGRRRRRFRVGSAFRWVCRKVCTYKCVKHCSIICYDVCKHYCSNVCSWVSG